MQYKYYLGTINKENGIISIDLFLKEGKNKYKPLLLIEGVYENRIMIIEKFFDILKNYKIEHIITEDNCIFNGRQNFTAFESDDLITNEYFPDNKI